MAISRYWRLVGIATPGNGFLELSEVQIYENGVLADASAILTATIAPASGDLADLRDGLATGVVSWPYASYSSPGFALVWDFGVGGGVELPFLRLGSGSSPATFAADLTAQSSVDGVNWTRFVGAISVVYPGDHALTSLPTNVDPYSAQIALLLKGNGADGSTAILDSSAVPKAISVSGNARISTSQSAFGGSSLFFDGNGSYLSTPAASDLSLVSGDFTIEARVFPTALTSGNMEIFNKDGVSEASYPQYSLAITSAGRLFGFLGNGNGVSPTGTSYTGTTPITLNTWHHLALVKWGNLCFGFLDGIKQWSAAAAPMFEGSKPLLIGFQQGQPNSSFYRGYMQWVAIIKAARYIDNFDPSTTVIGVDQLLPVLNPAPARIRQFFPTPERLLPAVDLPTTTAHGHLREFPFFDVFNGGIGLITGTVKEKSLPSNVPLARKVWLMDEASGMVVRETWSDATTGNYEFRGVKQGVKYTVLAYDYTHTYRAVVADNLETT